MGACEQIIEELTRSSEVIISTSRLLLNLEAAQGRQIDGTGRALVFGSYSDYAA